MIAACSSLASVGKVMALGCTVVSTVTRLRSLRAQRAALVRHPQALGQQQLQLVAEPLAPMAQVRALVRELVLEELFAGEVLEIRVMDPALAHAFVGQPVNVLEQQQPDHEAGLDPRPALVAVERRDLAVDPVPVDLAGELHQLVLHVDDLVEPRPEQIASIPSSRASSAASFPPMQPQNHGPQRKGIQKRNCKVRGPQAAKSCNLKCRRSRKTDSRSIA